jgi:hypothetical protein
LKVGAIPYRGRSTNKETTMLRNFAAALLATTLVAGSAFAAQPSATTGAVSPAAAPTVAAPAVKAAATQTAVKPAAIVPAATKQVDATKQIKTVTHVRKHARKHVAHAKIRTVKVAQHLKPAKTHRSHVAKTVVKGHKSVRTTAVAHTKSAS